MRKEPEQKDKEGLALTLEVTFTMKPANKKTNTDKDEEKEAGKLENEETDSEEGDEVKETTEKRKPPVVTARTNATRTTVRAARVSRGHHIPEKPIPQDLKKQYQPVKILWLAIENDTGILEKEGEMWKCVMM